MTELKGLEGYIAAMREPKQWETENCNTWLGYDRWKHWTAETATHPEQRWRRKAGIAEGSSEVFVLSGYTCIQVPHGFAGKTVRYRIEEVREP